MHVRNSFFLSYCWKIMLKVALNTIKCTLFHLVLAEGVSNISLHHIRYRLPSTYNNITYLAQYSHNNAITFLWCSVDDLESSYMALLLFLIMCWIPSLTLTSAYNITFKRIIFKVLNWFLKWPYQARKMSDPVFVC